MEPAAVVREIAVWREGLGDDLVNAGAFPVLAGENVVAAGEGEEAGLKSGVDSGQILDVPGLEAAEALGRQGLDRRQRIFLPGGSAR